MSDAKTKLEKNNDFTVYFHGSLFSDAVQEHIYNELDKAIDIKTDNPVYIDAYLKKNTDTEFEFNITYKDNFYDLFTTERGEDVYKIISIAISELNRQMRKQKGKTIRQDRRESKSDYISKIESTSVEDLAEEVVTDNK
ncbi:hypothetical protein GKC56_06655 [Neisseriaceae bacterium PsAf]|nr:hypothetical protein [Neisseriaceae bacterium PsAf]